MGDYKRLVYISLIIFIVLQVVMIQNLPPAPTYARRTKKCPTNILERRFFQASIHSRGKMPTLKKLLYAPLARLIVPKLIHKLDSFLIQLVLASAHCTTYSMAFAAYPIRKLQCAKIESSRPMRMFVALHRTYSRKGPSAASSGYGLGVCSSERGR